MFVNKFFPADIRKPIKELASHVEAAFRSLHINKCHLRFAVQMANQDGTPLCDYLVADILRVRNLLGRAYATGAGGVRREAELGRTQGLGWRTPCPGGRVREGCRRLNSRIRGYHLGQPSVLRNAGGIC